MTDSSRDLSGNKVRKLLEQYHPREAFKILALSMVALDQTVQTGSSAASVGREPRKIIISKRDSQQFQRWDPERVRVPVDEKDARSLIQKWKDGGRVKTGDLIGIVLYSRQGRPRRKR